MSWIKSSGDIFSCPPDFFEAGRLEAQLHRLDSVKLIVYMQDHFNAATAWSSNTPSSPARNNDLASPDRSR
jgi:hypothetical protein